MCVLMGCFIGMYCTAIMDLESIGYIICGTFPMPNIELGVPIYLII